MAEDEKKSYATGGRKWYNNSIFDIQEVIIVAAETERSSHKVYEKDKIGEVRIADEVVAIIAGLAATERSRAWIPMSGNITNELVGKLGMKESFQGREGGSDRGTCECEYGAEPEVWI